MFPKMSAWYDRDLSNPKFVEPTKITNEQKTSYDGPPAKTLENWYQILYVLIHRENEGDVDHTSELEYLRDEIYQYLR